MTHLDAPDERHVEVASLTLAKNADMLPATAEVLVGKRLRYTVQATIDKGKDGELIVTIPQGQRLTELARVAVESAALTYHAGYMAAFWDAIRAFHVNRMIDARRAAS